MGPRLYTLRSAPAPWGDYGKILAHGMTGHLARDKRGRLQLERTGPFVPPMTVPIDVIVTSAFRERLEASGLTGLRFKPVKKALIVRFEWEKWDRSAKRPPRIPFGGEPEDYILQGKHRPALARQMGAFFELAPEQGVRLVDGGQEYKWGSWWTVWKPDPASWSKRDFCTADRGSQVYVSDKARVWLRSEVGEWVAFEEREWAE